MLASDGGSIEVVYTIERQVLLCSSHSDGLIRAPCVPAVGSAVSLCNIAIHALVMAIVVQISSRVAIEKNIVQQPLRRAIIMIAIASVATVPVLMVAHFSEVIVWSLASDLVNATPAGADPIYFAFVNYTTLGYGDLTPVEHWRLLGPITAMNGVLLFNWSLRC
jgi:Ion channel